MDRVRLDKWLWAARFFKTRSLAGTAIKGGHVSVNGDRPKAGKLIHVGDSLVVRKGMFEHQIEVLALSLRRGTAGVAQSLYEETAESIKKREDLAAQRKADDQNMPRFSGRPTKKDRRDLARLRGKR